MNNFGLNHSAKFFNSFLFQLLKVVISISSALEVVWLKKKNEKTADIHSVFLEILNKILKQDREIFGELTE